MAGGSRGFTLVEVVVALLIIAFGVTAVVPMFITAARENAVAADLGWLGAAAVEQMETLRYRTFNELAEGGSVDSDVDGFHDPSNPEVMLRWVIKTTANPSVKMIMVRTIARRQLIGNAKQVTITTLRGR